LIQNFTSSIHGGFSERKEIVGTYRFLANDRVTESDLIASMIEPTKTKVANQRILVLCDTTEYNLQNHKERITDFHGIGSTSKNDILGFFSHNQLVLERESKQTLGWANVTLFNRPLNNKPFIRPNFSIPITQKESNKWYEPSLYSRDIVLKQAEHCLYVMDREADIYEVIDSLPNKKCDFLIRSKHDRIVNFGGERKKLKSIINQSPAKGIVKLNINGESKKRKKREAKCELRYEKITIPRPHKIYGKEEFSKSREITVLQIKEVSQIPLGETRIEWFLSTSEEVTNNKEACELLDCYSSRWTIEEVHRLLKTKGFNIESTELESGKSIRKLLLLGMEASIKVMELKAARSGESETKTIELFENNEIEFLRILNQNLQGSTELLSNPYDKEKLAWASWIIARLGGWKGYKSQRPPGTITFKRGLDKFYQQFNGFLLARKL